MTHQDTSSKDWAVLCVFSTLKGNSEEYQCQFCLDLKDKAKNTLDLIGEAPGWRASVPLEIKDSCFILYLRLHSHKLITFSCPWRALAHDQCLWLSKLFIFMVIFRANLADTGNYPRESHLPLVQCGVSEQCPMSQNPSLFPESEPTILPSCTDWISYLIFYLVETSNIYLFIYLK